MKVVCMDCMKIYETTKGIVDGGGASQTKNFGPSLEDKRLNVFRFNGV